MPLRGGFHVLGGLDVMPPKRVGVFPLTLPWWIVRPRDNGTVSNTNIGPVRWYGDTPWCEGHRASNPTLIVLESFRVVLGWED